MIPSLELVLIIGIVVFYLQDSAILLYYDELVFFRTRRRWHASLGGLQWRGRFLFLPNPLVPWRPLRRVSWMETPPRKGNPGRRLRRVALLLRPMQLGVAVQAVLLFLMLPLLLWRFPHPLAMLSLLAAIYATGMLLALALWRRRERLGLDVRTVMWLAIDCIVCPPHAINIVRRLGLLLPLSADALALAGTSLGQPERRRLAVELTERIEMVSRTSDDGHLVERLNAVNRRLEGIAS